MPLPNAKQPRRGYTLIEMLTVIALIGLMSGMVIVRFEPSVRDQLQGAAQIVGADLSYARNLAVSNDSKYTQTISRATNSCTLTHSGTNTLLNVLPITAYRRAADTATAKTTALAELPHLGPSVEVWGVKIGSAALAASGTVEFNSLGGVEGNQTVVVWLACGKGTSRRYQSLTVAPATGLVSYGAMQGVAP